MSLDFNNGCFLLFHVVSVFQDMVSSSPTILQVRFSGGQVGPCGLMSPPRLARRGEEEDERGRSCRGSRGQGGDGQTLEAKRQLHFFTVYKVFFGV